MENTLKSVQGTQTPLLRVNLFGEFQIAWQVQPFTQEAAWDRRTSARALFKLLLCAPGRQAPRSLLAGILWPDTDEERARESLRSACTVLRKVLQAFGGEELLEQRNKGDILKLAEQARLWVDADEFEDLVSQASRAISPDEALTLWRQAKMLLRGEFLADDQSSEWVSHRWVKTRRQTLWLARCRLIRHLADLYVQKGLVSLAEEELEQHIARFPTDQDALYRLLLLLEQQNCIEEACILYERTKRVLEAAGKQPATHLRTYYERLRKEADARDKDNVKREDKRQDQHIVLPSVPTQLPSNQQRGEQELPLALPTTRSSMSSTLILPFSVTQPGKPIGAMIPDCATMFGIQLSQIIALIQQWYGMAMFCHELQDQLDLAVKKLDALKLQYRLEEYALSRRSFLVSLAALPVALLTSAKQGHKLVLELEEMLPQCAASIIACWYLSGGSHLEVIEPILDSYLPTLIAALKHAPAYREVAADLVAQIYSLKAILAWHLEGLNHAETYCIQALNYSIVAKNANLRLTALNQHALISFYARNFKQALAKSEEADGTLGRLGDEERIFPIVQGRVYMYLAAIQAQQEYRVDAERTLERVHQAFALQVASAEPVPLYADCGGMSLSLWDGLTHYYLGQHDPTHTQRALNSLQMFGQLQPSDAIPERFRLECLNNRTLAAVQLNEMEEAIACLEAGKQGARDLESKQRRAEVDYAYREIHQLWSAETRVHVLADLLDGDGK